MTVSTIDKTFYEETGNRLSNISYMRLFNMLQDSDGTKYLNIWRSFVLNEAVTDDTVFYESYEVNNEDWLDNIAYYYYEAPGLWWVIAMMNDIVNPFEELEPGSNIRDGGY
jgi:hypothetical protein